MKSVDARAVLKTCMFMTGLIVVVVALTVAGVPLKTDLFLVVLSIIVIYYLALCAELLKELIKQQSDE